MTPPERLAHGAAEIAQAGYPWVKVILDFPDRTGASVASYSVNQLQEAVNATHRHGARLAVHAAGEGCAIGVQAGADSIEHGFDLDDGLLATMAKRGIAWTPTSVVIDELGFPRPLADEFHARLAYFLPRAEALGIRILAGTDMLPPGSVALEVASLARHGLSPRVALAAASTVARDFLGVPSLVEGAPADLGVYRHDPRDDPAELRRPEVVLHGGRSIRPTPFAAAAR